jgi:hypothetical protein
VQRHELRHSAQERAAAKAAKTSTTEEPSPRFTVDYNPIKPEYDERALKRMRPEETAADRLDVTESTVKLTAFVVKTSTNGARSGPVPVTVTAHPPSQTPVVSSVAHGSSGVMGAATDQFFPGSGPLACPPWGPPASPFHPVLQAAMLYHQLLRGCVTDLLLPYRSAVRTGRC